MTAEREKERRDFWKNAWLSCASASNCESSDVPVTWADKALKDFDSRFPEVDKTPSSN